MVKSILRPTSKQLAFDEWLATLAQREDRGTLAALRRGLTLDEENLYELFGHIPPYLLAGLTEEEQPLYLMVAALFGYHPQPFAVPEGEEHRYDFGAAMRALAEQQRGETGSADEDEVDWLPEPLKRRMAALLAAPRADLFGYLRTAVGLLKTKEISVDWALLLCHLHEWGRRDRVVQWQWSRSFYVDRQPNQEGDE